MVMSPQPCCSAISVLSDKCGTMTMHRRLLRISHPTDLQVISRGSQSGSMVCQCAEQPYESSHSHSTKSPIFGVFLVFINVSNRVKQTGKRVDVLRCEVFD